MFLSENRNSLFRDMRVGADVARPIGDVACGIVDRRQALEDLLAWAERYVLDIASPLRTTQGRFTPGDESPAGRTPKAESSCHRAGRPRIPSSETPSENIRVATHR